MMLQGDFFGGAANPADVVYTPAWYAQAVVQHFQPTGRILEPCRGGGVFTGLMPGCDWCEIADGRDFFHWRAPVDWIVTNPPYSIWSKFMRHAMTVAENIVFVIPVNKPFNSEKCLRDIWQWGGIKEIYAITPGNQLNFPIGFPTGAVHFKRGYRGPMTVGFLN
jgi:hypothetical protein